MAELISLILLSYNNGTQIYDAIDSYLIQDYPNLELILSDDGSRDFDEERIVGYIEGAKKENIKRVVVQRSPNNLGTVRNFNSAIRLAHGKYIKALGADDALYDNMVISRLAAYTQGQHAMIAFGRVAKCDRNLVESGKYLKDEFLFRTQTWSSMRRYKRLCHKNFIAAPGAFFSKEFFQKHGLFDESYRLLEDWPTWLRILRNNETIYYCRDIVAVKYRCDVGVSTGLNPVFAQDKITCFEKEIQPYHSVIGQRHYMIARMSLALYNCNILRKLYGYLKRS